LCPGIQVPRPSHIPGVECVYSVARSVRSNAPSAQLIMRDGAAAASYRPRHPEQLLLRRLVTKHLDEFLAEARAQHDKPPPAYVEKELRAFMECGIARFGFALAQCPRCGRKMAIAFSCKRRGACGSCITRRMCNAAAHLVNHVFPEVPVRQYVLSAPFELRLLLARDAAAYGAVTRIFAEEVIREQRERKSLAHIGTCAAHLATTWKYGAGATEEPCWCRSTCGGMLQAHTTCITFEYVAAPSTIMTVRLDPRLLDALKQRARREGRSVSAEVVRLIQKEVSPVPSPARKRGGTMGMFPNFEAPELAEFKRVRQQAAQRIGRRRTKRRDQ
jgi:plasmid stability protein